MLSENKSKERDSSSRFRFSAFSASRLQVILTTIVALGLAAAIHFAMPSVHPDRPIGLRRIGVEKSEGKDATSTNIHQHPMVNYHNYSL